MYLKESEEGVENSPQADLLISTVVRMQYPSYYQPEVRLDSERQEHERLGEMWAVRQMRHGKQYRISRSRQQRLGNMIVRPNESAPFLQCPIAAVLSVFAERQCQL